MENTPEGIYFQAHFSGDCARVSMKETQTHKYLPIGK